MSKEAEEIWEKNVAETGNVVINKEMFIKAWKGEFLKRKDLLELLKLSKKIFQNEKQLLEIKSEKTFFIGDTHGDFQTSKWALKKIFATDKGKIVFLGDYVDRGPEQIENINLLLAAKILAPKKIILLRGNHESPLANKYYGFFKEILRQYDAETYKEYNETFSFMPYVVLLNDKVLGLHGGIPENLKEVEEINSFSKGDLMPSNKKALQILWNDPKEYVETFSPSIRGPGIMYFGRETFKRFMEKNKLSFLIRAHEYFPPCIKYFFDGKLVSIFSCRFYPECKPKMLVFRKEKIEEVLELNI